MEKQIEKEYNGAMKKLHVYIETENKIQELTNAFAQLEAMGVEVTIHSLFAELMSGKRKELKNAGMLSGLPALEDKKDALFLTDIPQFASLLGAGGYPVLAYVHEGNRNSSLLHVKYVIEGFDDVDGEYFLRVWLRLAGKPWHIAQTRRCILRETTESDVDAFYEIYRDPSITKYMENLFEDRDAELQYTKDYREKIYEFYGFGLWTVLDKETGKVIGRAGISMREGYEDPELGFVIAKEFQGKGIATEVCQKAMEFVNSEFEFTRFMALVHKENQASLRVLHKLGFVFDHKVTEGGEVLDLYICDFKKSTC